MEKTVLYLHGFSSSSTAAKARYLSDRLSALSGTRFLAPDFNPERTDFKYLTVTGMINRLRQFVIDHDVDDPLIVASSLGCLVALHYTKRFSGNAQLLFLAPVLSFSALSFRKEALARWKEEGTIRVFHYKFIEELPLGYEFYLDGLRFAEIVPPPMQIDILHGRNDETIPVEQSREYVRQFPDLVRLTELDSDHMLHNQLHVIWDKVRSSLQTGP
jgi:pimeloyl-ACP methyl ester carboxylesterase